MSKRQALPLADLRALGRSARRASALRSGLAAAVVVLAAAAFAVAPAGGASPVADAGGRGTVAVLDVSGSISDRGSNEIQHALGKLIADAGPNGRIGLVLFSDVGMEALPPTAPVSALQPYRRFFIPRGRKRPHSSKVSPANAASAGVTARTLDYPQSPWGLSFSGGTAISKGLAAARASLRRAGMHGGRVVLLSDLIDSPQDQLALRRQLDAYARDPALELEVRALSTRMTQPIGLYRRMLGAAAAQDAQAGPPPPLPSSARRPLSVWLIALAALGAVALAANELLAAPLRWREA